MKKRVLYILQEYPQLSETYIYNELEHVSHRVELEIFASQYANLPYNHHRAFCLGEDKPQQVLDRLAAAFQPEIVHFHYVVTAKRFRPFCEHYGIPYTVRAHSFDVLTGYDPGDPAYREKLGGFADTINSDLCLGMLTFPFTCELFAQCGVRADKLHPAFPVADINRFFDRSENGPGIINVGAALAKKAMADFLRLANALPSLEFNLYPIGYGSVGLREENEAMNGRCQIHDPVQPEQMPPVYKRHRWLVYTADRATKNVGWPLAVAEAQAAGVGVCMANIRPDLAEYVGEGGGILFDDVDELRDILPGDVPAEMRERGFELCWRSDIGRNITQLTDLWGVD